VAIAVDIGAPQRVRISENRHACSCSYMNVQGAGKRQQAKLLTSLLGRKLRDGTRSLLDPAVVLATNFDPFPGILAVMPGRRSRAGTGGNPSISRTDDWITVNKDYFSQRCVNLDQITPRNVGKLKEICEIQLNEPTFFSSGLLKIGKTRRKHRPDLVGRHDRRDSSA